MERNKKIVIASGIVSVMVLFIGIAFAALASNINISFGNVTQNALTWNVGFKGSSVTPTQEGTSNTGLNCGTATVTPSTVTISDSTLSKPGDKCTYALTIKNKGSIAANLSNIIAADPTGLSCNVTNGSTMVCGNITYRLTTISGSALTTGITINKSETYNIKLVISYTGESLNSESVIQSNAKFTLTYSQSASRISGSGGSSSGGSSNLEGITKEYVCKRATTLHTETCTGTKNNGCYNAGYSTDGSKGTTTITYGNLGTSGTLTSGDAFDCDVNGDGTFDATTERFYYLSGVDGDDASDYAALIYYTNVYGGVISDTHSSYSTGDNYLGPNVAYQQMPTTSQWSNVSLSNQTRQIYAENGNTYVEIEAYDYDTWDYLRTEVYDLPTITYTDKAARMLSYKEVNKACNITIGQDTNGELYSCEYLLEHTGFSSWSGYNYQYMLENPKSDYNGWWLVSGFAIVSSTNGGWSVRPVIEVLKTDIDY